MKENYQIYIPYQFCPRVQSAGRDPQLPNKKMKTLFLSNTVEPRNNGFQGTSSFFPVVPNSGVANLTIFDHELAKNN